MLEAGFVVTSPRGTVMEILENTPERFRLKRTLPAGTGKTPSHRHDNGIERFRVLDGEATGSVGGTTRTLRLGDVMEVPVSSRHVHPHTGVATTAVVEHTIEPRPRFVSVFFASYLTWLGEGKVNGQDEPTLLQVMAIIKAGGGGTWVTGPPVAVQKVLATVLGTVAAVRGIRPVVPPGV
jgi:mannose-6-phosphate isomerase-like protein (cupin superfamily)